MKRLLTPLAVLSVLFASVAFAHEPAPQQGNQQQRANARNKLFQGLLARHLQAPRPVVGTGYGYGPNHYAGRGDGYNHGGNYGWNGYHHASTVGESHARGWAAMKEAQGRYNRDTAEAAILFEEARSRAMDNWRKGIDTYFDGRQANNEYRAAERGPRISAEALHRLAKDEIPRRLSPTEMNAVTGEIAWPILLRDDRFGPARDEIESLFSKHAITRGLNAEELRQVENVTGSMLKTLRDWVELTKPMEYTDALRFLESIAYEAKLSFDGGNNAG